MSIDMEEATRSLDHSLEHVQNIAPQSVELGIVWIQNGYQQSPMWTYRIQTGQHYRID
jgi:hypothetical protein